MSEATPGRHIRRHHHITLCTGGAQEDYDFHTKVLGLKSVKKTLLYDGQIPIYHLYYGNDMGEESTLVTSFPMRHTGRKSHKGSGQVSELVLSVPTSALDYWKRRLGDLGFEPKEDERFGERRLTFQHPCGIDYALAGIADDAREPFHHGPVPAEVAIRGTHAITVSVRDLENSDQFMQAGWGGSRSAEEGDRVRFELGKGGTGAVVDFAIEPGREPGSWTFGEGFVHHMAFQVGNFDEQNSVKAYLEGLGFTDVSDVKDRGYFYSIYVRTPGGALFEATVSNPKGFAVDEPADQLGHEVMLSPQFESQRAEILSQLETLRD
jgi:glyoxalase family protein